MKNRSLKVFLIVCVIGITLFVLFNYYIPSVIGATSQNKHRAKPIVKNPQTTKNLPAPPKRSIADDLGVPRPVTISYAPFNSVNIAASKKKGEDIFTVPEAIKTEVDFWKDIYTKYDKTQVVFHDRTYLNIIYSVLDISKIINSKRLTDAEKEKQKEGRVEKEMARIAGILRNLETKEYSKLTQQEKNIYHLFDNVIEKDKFRKAAGSDRLRSQTGIRDKFVEGIKFSGRYMGEIEKIFASYNIPREVTRLPFVESMFNPFALSKAGASGIWQFMPGSGRLYNLTIDRFVDERNDPILAAHAAAKHLLKDYEILGTWPLAISSYNSGRGRLERAVSKLGTKDIAKIIKGFDYPGYGFASRNFYPSFLAAIDVFGNRDKYFGQLEMDKPLKYDLITTPSFATLPELAEYNGVLLEDMIILNKHLQETVANGILPIPKGFKLKVPEGLGEKFLVAFLEMDKLPKYAKWHIVQPAENLKTIATAYKTNTDELKKINDLKRGNVKPGQLIKLPNEISLAKE